MIFCDMRRVELGEDLYLLLDILDLVFCTLEVNDLDRYSLLCPLVISARRGNELR